MKDDKDTRENRKPVKYTTVDWDSYRIKKEEMDARSRKKTKDEWTQPVVDEKWAVDKSDKDMPAYDFASDEEFNRALKEADTKQESGEAPMKEEAAAIPDKAAPEDTEIREVTADDTPEKVKRTKKKKSLGTKLDELGSSWVSSGNFRNRDDLDDKSFKNLENNIIVEASRRSSDEFLSKAVEEVNSVVRDGDGYEPLGEVSLADTFEIPKLDIHFGDTADLKSAKKDLKELRSEDLKKEIEKLDDLAASIEEQTRKELKEAKDADEAEKIIIKSDELKKKKRKKKSTAAKKAEAEAEQETIKAEKEPDEGLEPVRKRKKKPARTEKSAKTKKNAKTEIAAKAERPEDIPDISEIFREAAAGERPAEKEHIPARKKKKTQDTQKNKKSTEARAKKQAPVRKGEKAKAGSVKKPAADKKEKTEKETEKVRSGKKTEGISKRERGEKKSGPSEFRKRSADWKDKKVIDKTAKVVSFEERRKQFIERIKKVTPIQWSIAAMGVIIFITGIMTTAAYANYQGEENKALAIKSLTRYKDDESYEAVTAVTEEVIPEATEEPEPERAKALSLELSSVEKDLKIKLVDDEDTLVKGVTWSVTVAENKGDDSENTDDGEVYEDDDMDGTIYIENIAAGDYDVTLNPSDSLADYILPQEKQLVSVKAAIEYKVIANIKDEIKSEKEVNVALEDPNGNQAADVETSAPANIDTVEWCESTKEANGEEYIEATPDISKTAVSVKKSGGFLAALKELGTGTRKAGFRNSVIGFSVPVGYMVASNEEDILTGPSDENKEEEKEEQKEEPTPTPTPTPTATPTPTPTPTPTSAPSQSLIEEPAGPTPTPSPDSSLVDEASLSISGTDTVAVGASVNLTATYKPDSSTVSWSVSDIAIASLTDNGSTCQITGAKPGEVTVTASCSNGKQTTMKITVTEKEGNYSDDAKLYDASKNALYVKDGDEYRLATYGDYKSGKYATYYRKQEAFLYTGWQDIDGHTYYYKSDHTYVTGEQIIQGIKYNFASDGKLSKGSGTLGIDVSKYQPSINWASVKASGVSYVIIRCGYRGASTGSLIQDPYFTSHIKGAKAAGLKVGVYFFTTAINETEAVEEASMCAALCSGYGINYPVFMDCESSPRPGYNELSASERTAIIKAFCNTIKSAGYTPGVYANKTWLSSKMNASSLSGAKIWLAQYNSAGPTYSGRYDLWQYTSKGHVDGISGNVDMNQSYLGY